jgi:hypothetical protein
VTGILLSLKGGVIKPIWNCCCCTGGCVGVNVVVEVAVDGVAGVALGDEGGSKLESSLLARFRTFTKSGRSLED